MTSIKYSIITINFNNFKGLIRTIESVIPNIKSNVEFIIIDGGSNDGSLEVIKKYEKYITKWTNEKDTGVYDAMNKGIKIATGDYLLFLNSGDHFFEKNTINKYDNQINKFDFIIFDIELVYSTFKKIKSHPKNFTFDYLFLQTFAHQSVFIKRELFQKLGYYDLRYEIVSDWEFFMRAIVKNQASVKIINKVLSSYYMDGISSSVEGLHQGGHEKIDILKKQYKLFFDDYNKLQYLKRNRFKILLKLEKSNIAMKLNSLWLNILHLLIFFKIHKSK